MKLCLHTLWPLLTVAALLVGCSPRNSTIKMPEITNPLASKKPKPPVPIREIVCVWKHAEGQNGKGSPTRGVAGQILFFTHGNEAPIKIDDDSEVVIYMFHDQGTPEEQSKPISTFRFINKSWNKHLGTGQLGPTYQVFLPYNRKAVHQVKVTLSVRVVPKAGQPISSRPDTITLFGPIRNSDSGSFTQRIDPGNSTQKTNVSSFGARRQDEAFARLANKLNTPAPQTNRRGMPKSIVNQQADEILRRHGLLAGAAPANQQVVQTSGQREPAAANALSSPGFRLGASRTAQDTPSRRDEPRNFPDTSRREPLSQSGTGFQLKPAAGAPAGPARHATATTHREPAGQPRSDDQFQPTGGHPLGTVRPAYSHPREVVEQRHPLETGRRIASPSEESYAPRPQQQHPLAQDAAPSRRFTPKDTAWDASDAFDAPVIPSPAQVDPRAEIRRNFESKRIEHPLGRSNRVARERHPLAGDYDAGRSFR